MGLYIGAYIRGGGLYLEVYGTVMWLENDGVSDSAEVIFLIVATADQD